MYFMLTNTVEDRTKDVDYSFWLNIWNKMNHPKVPLCKAARESNYSGFFN